ncbi:MAG: hypothetical protein RIR62_983 [Pseudomonadota bacterium]
MRQIVSAVGGLWLLAAAPLWAQSTDGVVVELFTSQGCASCPPADAFLSELSQADGVIALALHVDYWDYIGWEDSFAQARFTDRQKMYARAEGSRTIYTPQMIIGGTDRIGGNTPDAVVKAIGKHMAASSPVTLAVTRDGARLSIRAEAHPPLSSVVVVQVVRYRPEATVTIERGENAGRTVTYHNIVTSWEAVAEWQGAAPLSISAEAPGEEPVVVILQEQGPARILAAARLD